MVPYVAAASCSGSGRTPREVAWGLALAAGSRLIDAKIGSFWHLATGGKTSKGEDGGVAQDGYDVSCTDACATPATGGCDESGMSEAGTEADLILAKPDAMICNRPGQADQYYSGSNSAAPYKFKYGGCFFGTGGTCDGSSSNVQRLCACKCGAGSSQSLPGIARSCPRYVPIAVGGTKRGPFLPRASNPAPRPFPRDAMARLEGAPCDSFSAPALLTPSPSSSPCLAFHSCGVGKFQDETGQSECKK